MKDYKTSCLMLATSLWTGIDLSAVFDDSDLKDTGIERDSHLTIFYDGSKIIGKEDLKADILTLLGEDYRDLERELKSERKMKVLDYFDLGKFENDSDYIVLRLRKDNDLYEALSILNSGLSSKYDISSDFGEYKPHMTLAELVPGTAKKYMFSEKLNLVLEKAKFGIDDFILSYGTGEPGDTDYKQYNITTYNAVSRYFRQQELDRDKRYYES